MATLATTESRDGAARPDDERRDDPVVPATRCSRLRENLATALARHPMLGCTVPMLLVAVQVAVNYKTWSIGTIHTSPLGISDLHKLYRSHQLYKNRIPYLGATDAIQYPVLTGVYMTVAADLTHGIASYFRLSVIGLWLCAEGTTLTLYSFSKRAAWWFAICPLLFVYSILNWDLFGILLMVIGWLFWTRRRYVLAASFLTLGLFAKLFPVVLLFFCFVELVRRARKDVGSWRDVSAYLGTSAAVAIVVNVPFMALSFGNWSYFWRFNADRTYNDGVLFYFSAFSHAKLATINLVIAAVLLALAVVGIVALWRGCRMIDVAAVYFLAFMLLEKVYSPQYALWLVAYALVAEWDFWTICVLTMMGLTNYANALTHIKIAHMKGVGLWYRGHVEPLMRGFRLGSIAFVAIAITFKPVAERLRRALSSPAPLVEGESGEG